MKKILVIEDEVTTRKTICKLLESNGYMTLQASDGEQAINILNDNKDFVLVVTDMQMPKMNGEQFIYSCREFDEYKNTPVLIVSGVVKLSEISRIVALDKVRFLPKPIGKTDLLNYINQLLN